MRFTRLLPWLLLLAVVVFSAAAYATLPAEVPRSIGLDGKVTHSAPRSPLSWGMLPLMAVLTQLVVEAIRRSLPRRPDRFNFPGKEDLLKLPAEYHPPVIVQMQWFLDMASSLTNGLFLAVQLMLWNTARRGAQEGASIALMLVTVFLTPVLFLLLQRVTNEVDAAKRKWESRRNPLAP